MAAGPYMSVQLKSVMLVGGLSLCVQAATNPNKCISSYVYLNLTLQITIAVRNRSIYDHFMYMTVHFMPCSVVLSREFITCALWTRLDLYSSLPPTNQQICSAYGHICLLQYMYVHYKIA